MSLPLRHPDVRQEPDRISWRGVSLALLVVLVASAVLTLTASTLVERREAELRPSGAFPEAEIGQRRIIEGVQEDIFSEKAPGFGQLQVEQQQRSLSTYRWIDRDGGIVGIPIEEAMHLVVEEANR